jgi:uncharacterized protein (TIGR02328 family)
MRLWHYKLIPRLPRQQLLGQHRECCALRGNGWGKKHATVNYVFWYTPASLWYYHMDVIDELEKRGYKVDEKWKNPYYRGTNCEHHTNETLDIGLTTVDIYPEHNDEYLQECLDNLKQKGIILDVA